MPKKKLSKIGGIKYYTRTACGKKFYSNISQEDADAKAEEYKKLKDRYIADPDISVADYVIKWYDNYKDQVGEHTADQYYYCCQVIIEYLGNYRLADTNPLILENEMRAFASTKLKTTKDYPSQKYISQIISVLKLIYKQAKKERFFDFNYAEDISVKSKKDRDSGKKRRALTPEELDRVLNFQHRYTPMVWFFLLCGLMPEELVPLCWGDITYKENEDQYTVSINKTALLKNDKRPVIRDGKAKTEFRLRPIPIPFPLSEWVKENIGKNKKKDLIFPDRNGEVLSRSALTGRFNTYLIDLDCWIYGKQKFNPKEKFHFDMDKFCMYDLRHTYITLLVSLDTPVRKTTALAGHSGTETADKYYIDYKQVNTGDDVKKLGDYLKNKVSDSA